MQTTPYTENSTVRTDWTINGFNKDFDLSNVPDQWSVRAYVNGFFAESTVSSSTVTLANAPGAGDYVVISYTVSTDYEDYHPSSLVIANRALVVLGAEQISALDDGSPNADRISAVYSGIRDEVLQERDWKFARQRVALTKNATEPEYNFLYAYNLPTGFLRLVKPKGPVSAGMNPVAAELGSQAYFDYPLLSSAKAYFDYPVWPPWIPFTIESLSDGTLVLMTNYDNTDYDIYINYIRSIADATIYPPIFATCLVYRLADEIAEPVTHDQGIKQKMADRYLEKLYSAQAANQCLDMVDSETGSYSWENAGRG